MKPLATLYLTGIMGWVLLRNAPAMLDDLILRYRCICCEARLPAENIQIAEQARMRTQIPCCDLAFAHIPKGHS